MGQAPTATLNPNTANNLNLSAITGTPPANLPAIRIYRQQNALLFLNQTPPFQTFLSTFIGTFSLRRAFNAALMQRQHNLETLQGLAARLQSTFDARIDRYNWLLYGMITIQVGEQHLAQINALPEVAGLLAGERQPLRDRGPRLPVAPVVTPPTQ